jgi:phospho-N-acetylmuramoyl-pentapeptide-transferase
MYFDSYHIARLVTIFTTAFVLAFILMPIWIAMLKKWNLGKVIRDSAVAPIMAKLHAHKSGTPAMGGLVIWGTVLILILAYRASCALNFDPVCSLSFLSRAQTRLPLGILISAGLIGLLDDYLNAKKIGPKGGGLRMRSRLISYTALGAIAAYWFYSRLEWDFIHLPFVGTFNIGWWYIPFFVLVFVATSFSANETDGLDGLAGGTFMTSFGVMAIISYAQGRLDLSAFCLAILGALLAFLWFNVPKASVFMGDTGSMALGSVLASVAMITNTALLLPIIAFPFVVESVSVLIQLASKKLFKRKVFLSSPFHHHLEAIGWSESQIVMRSWIVSIIFSAIGLILALADISRVTGLDSLT